MVEDDLNQTLLVMVDLELVVLPILLVVMVVLVEMLLLLVEPMVVAVEQVVMVMLSHLVLDHLQEMVVLEESIIF